MTAALPEREFSEENQQVAMKRERQLLFFMHLLFASSPSIFHHHRYIFVTANCDAIDKERSRKWPHKVHADIAREKKEDAIWERSKELMSNAVRTIMTEFAVDLETALDWINSASDMTALAMDDEPKR